ncbi:hypothetical protein Dimus_032133 [Dionaea muscipula]
MKGYFGIEKEDKSRAGGALSWCTPSSSSTDPVEWSSSSSSSTDLVEFVAEHAVGAPDLFLKILVGERDGRRRRYCAWIPFFI